MSARTLISVEDYLASSYEPDCDFVDGHIEERNLGELAHAKLQLRIGSYLLTHYEREGVAVATELRIRVSPARIRIPDVCVISGALPQEDILSSPPLIWIEVLSPEDRPLRVQKKVREVLDFGCPWVWVIEPETLESRVYTPQSDYAPEGGVFRIPGTEIAVPLGELEG